MIGCKGISEYPCFRFEYSIADGHFLIWGPACLHGMLKLFTRLGFKIFYSTSSFQSADMDSLLQHMLTASYKSYYLVWCPIFGWRRKMPYIQLSFTRILTAVESVCYNFSLRLALLSIRKFAKNSRIGVSTFPSHSSPLSQNVKTWRSIPFFFLSQVITSCFYQAW